MTWLVRDIVKMTSGQLKDRKPPSGHAPGRVAVDLRSFGLSVSSFFIQDQLKNPKHIFIYVHSFLMFFEVADDTILLFFF